MLRAQKKTVSPRRSIGALLLLLALVATGCGAGRHTETDKERATPYVADANAGSVAVRAIRIVVADSATTTGTTPSAGATPSTAVQAYLTATFINRGESTDTLVNATVAGGAVAPGGFDLSGLPLPPHQVVQVGDPDIGATGPTLGVGALATQLQPGTIERVTLTFKSGGTVTINVPVMTSSDIGTNAPTAPVSERASLSAALVLDGLDRLGGGGRIEIVATALHRTQRVVQFIAQRDAGRDVEPRDLVVPDVVEVLHERAQ